MYDTSGNTGGAENSTAFWTLMSPGPTSATVGPKGIGDDPTDLSAWELLNLGWLGAQQGQGPSTRRCSTAKANIKLGPNVPGTKSPQAAFVVLPDSWSTGISARVPRPATYFWSVGKADTTSTLTASVAGTSLAAKVRYDIEPDWDYAFLRPRSAARGRRRDQPVDDDRPQRQQRVPTTGITGTSAGYDTGAWVSLTATLPGRTTAVRFAYVNDPAGSFGEGFGVDSRDRRRRRDRRTRRGPSTASRRRSTAWSRGGLLQRLRAGEPPVRRL